jgi:hypothetical protein
VDSCLYDVYYAFSEDGGQSFSQPLQLNETAIAGEGFVVVNGRSQAGAPAAAAADDAAHVAWIDGGQLYTLRLER